ncbi:MAG: hypothetical protein M1817_005811 [Caeruleum heppii]|nr:MAG: hypothetical protein M1817_005811 [Caeruleum heppii]
MERALFSEFTSAGQDGNLERIRQLVNSSPEPNYEQIGEAFHEAVVHGHASIVSFLLDHGAKISALTVVFAGRSKELAVFQAFLDHGWDINMKLLKGAPGLKIAVTDEALLKWLLDHGADPNRRGDWGEVALDFAANAATIPVMSLLLDAGAQIKQSNALHAATRRPDGLPMMDYLLSRGADIDALELQHVPDFFDRNEGRNRWGQSRSTALHQAVRMTDLERIRFLLDKGANRQVGNYGGASPARCAEHYGGQEDRAGFPVLQLSQCIEAHGSGEVRSGGMQSVLDPPDVMRILYPQTSIFANLMGFAQAKPTIGDFIIFGPFEIEQ